MTLREVYDNPKTTTRNPALLAKRANTSVKSAQAFLRDQQSSQVSRRVNKPSDNAYAPTGGHYGSYLGDVIFLTDYAGANAKRASILTIMGANNRYAYARAMTSPLTSAKTAAALLEILEENAQDVERNELAPILTLRIDGGPEFSGEFAKLAAVRKIPLSKGEAGTHEQLARLDRFHRSLRQLIGDHFALTDSHQWFKVLPELIANYNSRPNHGLAAAGVGIAPVDVGVVLERTIIRHDLARARRVRIQTDKSGVGDGTRVRLLTSRMKGSQSGKLGNKSHEAVWSSDVYTIVKRAGVNSFLVDVPAGQVKIWPLHSLQIVDKSIKPAASGLKVDKKVISAKRLEARNISPEENASALAAPAAKKRVSKPTIKAVAIARPKRAVKIPKKLTD